MLPLFHQQFVFPTFSSPTFERQLADILSYIFSQPRWPIHHTENTSYARLDAACVCCIVVTLWEWLFTLRLCFLTYVPISLNHQHAQPPPPEHYNFVRENAFWGPYSQHSSIFALQGQMPNPPQMPGVYQGLGGRGGGGLWCWLLNWSVH